MLNKNSNLIEGRVAQWVNRPKPAVSFELRAPSKATVVSLSKKLYHHCLVLVQVPGMNFRVVDISKNCLFHNQT